MYMHSSTIDWGFLDMMMKIHSLQESKPWFKAKMASYWYKNSSCGEEMAIRLFYVHNGNSFTG